ncbi:MAG: type II toxin-antitoxin system prevent-host-death family antitoxin [Bryobacteraceae bacterium]
MEWQLAEAKNKFCEVVRRALSEGPQVVLHRRDAVVILDRRHYDRLTGKSRSFTEFLVGGDPTLEGVDLTRDKSPSRGVDL